MKNTKLLIAILSALLIVTLGVGAVVIGVLVSKNGDKAEQVNQEQKYEDTYGRVNIGVEAGIVTGDGEGFEKPDTLEYAESFTTEYKRDIYVKNGREATCYIGNSEMNPREDMYFQIFLTDGEGTLLEEVYLSKIIPRGAHVESFTTEFDMEPGEYTAICIFACMDENGTLVNNVPVVVDIHVES